MSITGIETHPTHPPKVARELKEHISMIFGRYGFDEVMAEIAKQKPKVDISVSPAKPSAKPRVSS